MIFFKLAFNKKYQIFLPNYVAKQYGGTLRMVLTMALITGVHNNVIIII